MASSWENIEVDSSNMRAYVSVPDGAQRVPGIIVLQGQSGVDKPFPEGIFEAGPVFG